MTTCFDVQENIVRKPDYRRNLHSTKIGEIPNPQPAIWPLCWTKALRLTRAQLLNLYGLNYYFIIEDNMSIDDM